MVKHALGQMVVYITMPGMPENTMGDTKSASILSKMITIYGLNCINSKENDINYCLNLNIWRLYWILPGMQCPIIHSGHTTMSGVPENPMVDTKITSLLLF